MSWFESVSPKSLMPDGAKSAFDPQLTAMVQLGAMSPLWMMFIGASTAGMAYWGMTRWMRLATPEAITANVVKLRLVKPVAAPAAPPMPELEMVVPKAVAAVIEAVAELAPEPVAAPEPVKAAQAQPEPTVRAAAPQPVVAPAPMKAAPAPQPAPMAKAEPVKPAPVEAEAVKRVPAVKPPAPAAKKVPTTAPAPKAAPPIAAPAKAAAPKPVVARRSTAKTRAARKTAKAKPKT